MGKATRNATVYQSTKASLIDTPYVPPGWVLVPEKPTEAWIEAMHRRTSYPQVKLAIEMMLITAPRYEQQR